MDTVCPACGERFGCQAATGNCWCMNQPRVLALPEADANARCLCPNCLAVKTATINLPPVTVAYLRQVGPYGPSLRGLWDELTTWAKARGLWTDSVVTYGISLDNPNDTPPNECRYDACIAISEGDPVDGAKVQMLPGGRYVVEPFHGTAPQVDGGFYRVFNQVIPQSGYTFDVTRPVFERYAAGCRIAADGSFNCDLCVPVQMTVQARLFKKPR